MIRRRVSQLRDGAEHYREEKNMLTTILCADSESLRHPSLIGLDDVDLASVSWLNCFSDAQQARSFARFSGEGSELWVASSDDVEAINLAAALRIDNQLAHIYLIDTDPSGSMLSRASAAGVTAVLNRGAFMERFVMRKQAHAKVATEHVSKTGVSESNENQDDACVRTMSCEGAHEGTYEENEGGKHECVQEERSSKESVETKVSENQVLPLQVSSDEEGVRQTHAFTQDNPAPYATKGSSSASSKRAHIITVVSGSGGAGKSTVAALMAHLCSEAGMRTLLLDCDLQFGDMHRMLGMPHVPRLNTLIETTEALTAYEPPDAPLALVAAPERLEQAEVIGESIPVILDTLAPRFDVIVANTGASWAEYHALLLERSAATVFLIDQRASSVWACRHALDLCARCGIATGSFHFVLNRCGRSSLLTSIDVSCALQGAHVVELADGGSEVEEMLGVGLFNEFVNSGNDLLHSTQRLLSELLPEDRLSRRASQEKKASQMRFFARSKRRKNRKSLNKTSFSLGSAGGSTTTVASARGTAEGAAL